MVEYLYTKIKRDFTFKEHFITWKLWLKPGQNKKDQNVFQLHRFLNTFLQLAAENKYSKKWCSWKCFRPFLFCDGFTSRNDFPRKR